MKRPQPRPITDPIVCDARWDKNGPPPHTTFRVCGVEADLRVHESWSTGAYQDDLTFIIATPCDGTCKGWFTIKRKPQR